MNVLPGTSASIRDVQCGAKELHQLLLIVGEVSPHDIHARSQQTLKSSNFENCRKKKKKKKRVRVGGGKEDEKAERGELKELLNLHSSFIYYKLFY